MLLSRRGDTTIAFDRLIARPLGVANRAAPLVGTLVIPEDEAGNLARSEFRRAGRYQRLLRRVPVEDTVRDHADHVIGQVDGDRRPRRVLDEVERLPRSEREAVELCLLGELSIAEAAEALGVAEVSVRSRILRARSRLRTTLEEQS